MVLLYIIVVNIVLYLAGFLCERLKVCAHQFDVNGIVVLPTDRELIIRVSFLEPYPHQFHDFRGVLPLVITAFPMVFVIHVFGIFFCRGSRTVMFISGRSRGNIRSVFLNIKEFFKLYIYLLHNCSVTTLIGMVLQCQTAVLLLQVRQTSYVLKISHDSKFLCPCEAVDKIFLIIKVKAEIAARHLYIIFPQIVHFLQFAQVSDFGVQVFLRFRLTATA